MLASSRNHRRFVVWLFLTIGGSGVCYGQPTILVLAQGNPSNPALSGVIEKAAAIELKKNENITVTVPTTSSEGGAARTSHGGAAVADFLLLANYTQEGGDVRLQMSLRDPKASTPIASRAATLPFSLSFDVGVSAAVARLMEMPGVAAALKQAAARSKSAVAAKSKGRPQKAGNARSVPSKSAAAGTAGRGPATPPAPRHVSFTITASGAPLILVGNASNYFRYGAGASLHLGLQIPFGRMDLQTGFVAGANALIPAVGIAEGMVYALPVGPELQLGTSPELPVAMGIRASGGAAFILSNPASLGLEAKTDLFASGSLTAHLRISRSFIIGTQLGMLVVFEERYPILAVEPTLSFGFSP